MKLGTRLDKLMPFITPVGVAIGFLLGSVLSPFKPAVTYLFAYITLIGAMGMDLADFKAVLKRPFPLIAVFLCSHAALPALTRLLAGLCFPGRTDIITGYVLLSSIPIAVSSYIWTSIFYGNGAVSLTVIIIDTLLAPIVTPLTVKIFADTDVSIDTGSMILSLFLMIVIPSLAGIILNHLSRNRLKNKVVPYGKPFSKLALLGVISINASQVAGRVAFGLGLIPIVLVNIMVTLSGFLLGYFAARLLRLDKDMRVSMTYTSGMRNISAAMVLAISFFPPDTSIPVVVGIILQQSAAAFIGYFLFTRKQSRTG
ncbi:bile acid:sodium symporter family protein [Treponema sp. OttesenSCG-928-L16]|nr:bile acid:sodium symporter family protein [Treponema sp. OttesenSCG-928-L16]